MADTEPREPPMQTVKDIVGTVVTVVCPVLALAALCVLIVGGMVVVACSTGPCF
jgi:hypothetical protein